MTHPLSSPSSRTCGVMAQYLPPKVEQVVFCKMSPLQLKLYQAFYNSPPVQGLLRGGRAAQVKQEAAARKRAALVDITNTQQDAACTMGGAVDKPVSSARTGSGAVNKKRCHTSQNASGVVAKNQAEIVEILNSDQENVGVDKVTQGTHAYNMTPLPPTATSGPAAPSAVKQQPATKASGTAVALNGVAGDVGGVAGGIGTGRGPREPELSVLAAITAVKKLCCHPDLVSG